MRDIVLLRFRENYNVVNVRIAQFSDFLSKDFINCPLTYARRILKTKWESAKFKLYVANGKGRLFPFFLSQDFMAKVVKYWALPTVLQYYFNGCYGEDNKYPTLIFKLITHECIAFLRSGRRTV